MQLFSNFLLGGIEWPFFPWEVKGTLKDTAGCVSASLLPLLQGWAVIREGGRLHKDGNEEENTDITVLELYRPSTLTFFGNPIYLAKQSVQFCFISPSV